MKISKIRKKLENVQTPKRYEHTIAVAYTSACLAMKYDINPSDAYLAGLLHDCAKHLSNERYIELSTKYNLGINEIELANPFLLHGKVGALIANRRFDISNEDILNAIRFHTSGRPSMSLLEKIVFVADYIEPNRDKSLMLPQLRKLAFENIDECIVKIYDDTFIYLINNNRGDSICPISLDAYSYYKKETNY